MLSFIPSKDTNTIAIEFDGKATKEDLQKMDRVIEEKFSDKEKFNVYAVMHDIDGATVKAMAEEMKIDAKRWSQYHKLAVISEKNWLETMTDMSDYLPGIKAKHFAPDQMNEAWDWIQQE
ncbi:STAS/SEC14 domain-containing protein [Planococcus salinus]|uniref:STAS/SEC14 domain-containing protein n=1 Tax=Planococcus salinus TaxID=1848460 RepID=A0A3M8P5P8_9BACL|nr:STAS/SEC14 domain-containing protein [Planococcus salinus]RNF38721.1 STAS/SEC14 domain-containing protein [Planococcus salinus]